VAILPTLSQKAVTSEAEFKATLAQGLKLVLVLIIPAVVGMLLLARPITALLYQTGEFTALDTAMVSLVLQVQMIGVFFAALDQPLIFAFYARKDTLTPALVGMAGVGVYLLVAFVVSRLRPLTLLDLVAANDAQLAAHALVMLALFQRRLGGFMDSSVWTTIAKAALAALGMGTLTTLALWGVRATGLPEGSLLRALSVGVPGLVGVAAYFMLAARFNLAEVRLAADLIRRRLGV
jgi:putative peptidoglycan lipid II flippase